MFQHLVYSLTLDGPEFLNATDGSFLDLRLKGHNLSNAEEHIAALSHDHLKGQSGHGWPTAGWSGCGSRNHAKPLQRYLPSPLARLDVQNLLFALHPWRVHELHLQYGVH